MVMAMASYHTLKLYKNYQQGLSERILLLCTKKVKQPLRGRSFSQEQLQDSDRYIPKKIALLKWIENNILNRISYPEKDRSKISNQIYFQPTENRAIFVLIVYQELKEDYFEP